MANIDHREFTDRVQTQTQPRSPELRVQADQDTARGHGSMMFALADAINKGGSMVVEQIASHNVEQNKLDYEKGKVLRNEEHATGVRNPETDAFLEASNSMRKGYFEVEGLLKADQWAIDTAKQLEGMEITDDVTQTLNESAAKFLEGQPPEAKATLAPAMARLRSKIMAGREASQITEIETRQKENASILFAKGLQDGSLSNPVGLANFKTFLNRPEFGYLDNREANDIILQGAKTALESGEGDSAGLMSLLSAPNPDGTPGLAMIPAAKQDLEAAMGIGKRKVELAAAAAAEEAYNEHALEIENLKDSGRYTDARIEADAVKYGYSAAQKAAHHNANQASIKRIEAEHAQRLRDAEARSLLPRINVFDPSADYAKGSDVDKAIFATLTQARQQYGEEGFQAASVALARNGQKNPILKALSESLNLAKTEESVKRFQLYRAIKTANPIAARQSVTAEFDAAFNNYESNVKDAGMRETDAVVNLAAIDMNDKLPQAKTAYAQFLKDSKLVVKPAAGGDYNGSYRSRVERATVIGIASGQSPQVAYEKARKHVAANTVVVSGLAIPREELRDNAVGALNTTAAEVKRKLIADKTSGVDAKTPVQFIRHKSQPGVYVLVNMETQEPVISETATGSRQAYTMNPSDYGQVHDVWERKERDKVTVKKQMLATMPDLPNDFKGNVQDAEAYLRERVVHETGVLARQKAETGIWRAPAAIKETENALKRLNKSIGQFEALKKTHRATTFHDAQLEADKARAKQQP